MFFYFAFSSMGNISYSEIFCLCKRCVNRFSSKRDDVKQHLYYNGFMPAYYVKPRPFARVDVRFGSVEFRFGLCGSSPTHRVMILTCGMMTSNGGRWHLINRSVVSVPELSWWIRV